MATAHIDSFEDDVHLCSDSDEDFEDDTDEFQQISPPPSKQTAFHMGTIDPDIDTLGSPSDLNNFLPDSGASQHMTPRLDDLFDMEEDHNIGVQVADGHVIKCNKIGKIQIEMIMTMVIRSLLHYMVVFTYLV